MKEKSPTTKSAPPASAAKTKYVKPEMKEVNVAVSKKVLRVDGAGSHCSSHSHCADGGCAAIDNVGT